MNVTEAVTTRRSVRQFLDKPVPYDVIRRVMDTARWSPSGCNYQPWQAAILTGKALEDFRVLIADKPMGQLEYSWDAPGQYEEYKARLGCVSAKMFEALGIARDDGPARMAAMLRNKTNFDAPCLLLCYFPKFMLEPQWSDTGMWLQTIALLLREQGLDSCFQEFMAFYAREVREFLGLDADETMFFCGMAIGYRDPDAPVNNFERERVPLDEQVRFLGFE